MTLMMIQSAALALVFMTSLLAVPSQAVRPALLRIQPVTTVQRQNYRFTTTNDFEMVNEDAERSLQEVLAYHPEMRKLVSYVRGGLLSLSLPIDLSLSIPIDLSLSIPMTPPPGIHVDESSDGDSGSSGDQDEGDAVAPIGNDGSSGGGTGQGDAPTGQNNDFVNEIFSTIRSGVAGANGLGLGKTGQTGLVLFFAVGGLVVVALIVDQKRRAAAAKAAASMSGVGGGSSSVAGAYYDDNSTFSGASIAAGGTTDQFV